MSHASSKSLMSKPLMNTPRPFAPNTTLTIDGISVVAEIGEPLIDAINRASEMRHATPIPQVCYLKPMGAIGSCDTCMVEQNGELVRSCERRVTADATILTASQRADAAQREAFDRLLVNHDLYCTVCDNNNQNCTMHNTTADLHVVHQTVPFTPKPYEKDMSNPFYRYDPDQCIACGRCVEACQNVQVNETLTIDWSRSRPRVMWDGGETIDGSSCVSCGHCVTVCPCNALMEKGMLGKAGYLTNLPQDALDDMIAAVKGVEPSTGYPAILALSEVESQLRPQRVKRTKTVCTYCGVGCSFDIWTRDREILKIEPMHGAANGISTCVKGKFGWDFVNSPDRLRKPLKRVGNTFVEIEWDEAIGIVAEQFTKIKQEHGPDALGFIASSKCTNEESYLMMKLARAVVGTNNIDNCSRYCQTPASKGLSRTMGIGGDTGSIADIERADLVLIIGSNTSESHPVLATRVKRSHKHRGQRLIVADLRKHEMAERADLFVRPNPSTDEVWLQAVTKHLIDTGRHNQEFIDKWVQKWPEYKASLEPYTLEYAEQVTGIPVAQLKQIADEIAAAKNGVCVLWAMGVTQHCGGSDTSTSICNMLLATGNVKKPGAGAYPLRGHNNVQGASDFGSMPDVFSGYQKVSSAEIRGKFEAAWNVTLPVTTGLDNRQMIHAILEGKLRSMYIKGEDTITSDANANEVEEALSKLDFLVVQDIFFSETCKYADLVLPASPSLEKEGTFVNTERRIQRLYQVFEPLADSKPDWEIIQLIAERMGGAGGWSYAHPSEVMDEAAKLTPHFAGVSYERLEGYKTLQWPVAEDGTDSPILYADEKPFALEDGKATFWPLEYVPPSEQLTDTYDLHLNNGRALEHFEQGNMTYRVPGINAITPEMWLEISPELAEERGITTGRFVKLESPYGQIRAKVLVTHRVEGRQMYLPMISIENPVNRLTSSHVDRTTHTPAYKELSVKMTPLPQQGESPLPRRNFRFGQRTPTSGVEVELKRERADYHMPGSRPQQAQLVQIETTKSA
ncbi:formate dehydrogenase subunit alpha [Granulicella cerasi]|uniref:Formate dehydrogenase subunit alpha n=1 Tax=Granulicella cerasi TaxID=741063 RepID=A0ABW1Z8E0_9BACT|nr:formate dehydrogenase subunit alpha [Granulicella cerasi]